MTDTLQKILVIKHGAFGDLIQSFGAMQAIRAYHPGAEITLLTTKPFLALMQTCPHIDQVSVDAKPKFFDLPGLFKLRAWLRGQQFTRVYDLQNSDRSCAYFMLMMPAAPEWVGTAFGASHRNISPARTAGRAFEGHVQTLGLAGITNVQIDPLDWLVTDLTRFTLPARYALLVPGSSPEHPQKRWPAPYYADLARALFTNGITPVVIGARGEQDLGAMIAGADPRVVNLCGQTQMNDLPSLARGACIAIGNDTGPMHLCGVTGCPSLTLFDTRFSVPHRHQPLGPHSHGLAVDDLSTLAVDTVIQRALALVRSAPVLPGFVPATNVAR